MSDTPRTDALRGSSPAMWDFPNQYEPYDSFCEELERESARRLEALRKMQRFLQLEAATWEGHPERLRTISNLIDENAAILAESENNQNQNNGTES